MTTESKATGPVPLPQQESDFYWEKLKAHELWLRKCNETGKAYFYPRDISPFTFSRDTSWIQSSGKGTLFTYAICYTPIPRYTGPVPFIIAMVELEEGPLIPTNIVEVEPDPSNLTIGMPEEVTYEDITDNINITVFDTIYARALTQFGQAVSNVAVQFTKNTDGFGYISEASVLTDDTGQASSPSS